MRKTGDNPIRSSRSSNRDKHDKIQGYPLYPVSEDIYNKFKEEEDLNPEEISGNKEPNEGDKGGSLHNKDFADRMSGSGLDVPGSELDDIQENAGSEDEENNYYSLGGDDHNNLDEDQGG